MSELTAKPAYAKGVDAMVVDLPQRSRQEMLLKRAVQGFFSILGLRRLLFFHAGRILWGRDRALLAASESLARVPGMRGVYARQAFYRRTLASCGRDVYFGFGSLFSVAAARLGDRVYIGRQCSLGFVDIGNDARLADGAIIISGGHEHGRPDGTPEESKTQQIYRRVTIGEGVWIGSNAVVMASVGPRSVVGAGAVVNREIPPGSVAVGVPARVVRRVEDAE
jgi:acetyltransferase-like isoleucine patch superfamily enzyme